MDKEDKIKQIMSHLPQLSADSLGDVPHSWVYDPAQDAIVLALPVVTNQGIDAMLAREKDLVEQLEDVAKAVTYTPSTSGQPGRVLLKPQNIDLPELEKKLAEAESATPVEAAAAVPLRPVGQNDLPMLESLGFGEYFPLSVTDGHWRMTQDEHGDVARLTLKFPPDTTTTDAMEQMVRELKKILTDFMQGESLYLHLHSPPKYNPYNLLNVLHVDIAKIDPEQFKAQESWLQERIKGYGELISEEMGRLHKKTREVDTASEKIFPGRPHKGDITR